MSQIGSMPNAQWVQLWFRMNRYLTNEVLVFYSIVTGLIQYFFIKYYLVQYISISKDINQVLYKDECVKVCNVCD